jgi:hypothetical protein
VVLAGGAGGAAYLALAWLLRVEELRWLIGMVRKK